jgi:anaerobic selenocysteine-containing dehydrogenase
MNAHAKIGHSACPHDCPSTCALDVELLPDGRMAAVHGAEDNSYTAGVICAKVARYAERVHHPDRLMHPLRRKGPKGSGPIRAHLLGRCARHHAEAMLAAERPLRPGGRVALLLCRHHGPGDARRHQPAAPRQALLGMYATICTTLAWTGYIAGTGQARRPRPARDGQVRHGGDLGHQPRQHAGQRDDARHARPQGAGAKIVAVDIYHNGTMQQADLLCACSPGTDGALACAVMHVLFRDGYANWPYLEKYTDCPRELEAHLAARTPEWASAITGLSVAEIETFAKMVGTTPKTYFRLGYGFARSRNGAHNMHAALCIPSVTGAWLTRAAAASTTTAPSTTGTRR